MFDQGRAQISPQVPVSRGAMSDFFYFSLHLRVGRLDSARSRIHRLWTALPEVEEMKTTYPMLAGISEAELLLAEGKPDSAIAVYRATPVIHPTNSAGWRAAYYNVPILRDVVPRAFQRKGDLDSAIAEYERLLRVDPATRDRRWIHPLYHYRLASLCQRAGRTDKAIAEYRRFLELWKDADGDRPELRDARKQLALVMGKKGGAGTS